VRKLGCAPFGSDSFSRSAKKPVKSGNTLVLYVYWLQYIVHESIQYECIMNATACCLEDSELTIASEMPRRKKDDSSFGPRLTAVRKARGLTQIQLAEAAGTTQRSISYYQNDDGVPPSSAVIALAKALKVSADELLGLRPPRVERVNVAETKRLWRRFQMVTALPEKDQRAVIRLINSLASVAPRREASLGERNGR
jgi:transcriptional regulator with XRE-family HTH domain